MFADAVVTPVILIFENEKTNTNLIYLFELRGVNFNKLAYELSYERIKKTDSYNFSFNPTIKINVETLPLSAFVKFSLGIKTSDDKRFIFNEGFDSDCYPMLRGRNIKRYLHEDPSEYLWYKPELINQKPGGRPRVLQNFLSEKTILS